MNRFIVFLSYAKGNMNYLAHVVFRQEYTNADHADVRIKAAIYVRIIYLRCPPNRAYEKKATFYLYGCFTPANG